MKARHPKASILDVGCGPGIYVKAIEEKKARPYISFIDDAGPEIVYFSAACPGQGGHGHINLQPKSYWVEKFHRAGFWLDPDATAEWVGFIGSGYHLGWLTQNGLVFRRG
jgi:hypothetical protein